ncbi:MAG: DHA2 family efflux MFS transporter permease subunit [Candidatus Omnitrophota bacterium]
MDYPVKNRKFIAIAVVFGAFLSVMDVSVVNVALPHMMGNFGQTLSAITWVATSYSIAEIIMVMMTGWLSRLFGRKKLYLFSFALFTVGSALCATAHTFPQMIIYRVIQGIGGGCLIPISQAILRETFPPKQQGMAMAFFGMGVVLAPAIGPVIGGWLTDHYGWPWIFYINIPFSLVGMLMINAFVHDPHYLKRGVSKIDWFGIALLTIGLTGLQIFLERGQESNWFESGTITATAIVTALALTIFVIRELMVKDPIVNFRLLKDIRLSVGSIMVFLFGIALFGTTFVLPQFTQQLLGYPAFEAGLVLLPRAMMLFCCMPIVGFLFNHLNPRWMIIFGISVIFVTYMQLAHLSLDASFMNLVPILVLMGVGMPFMFVTLSTTALISIPREEMTQASGIYTLAQRVGGNVGYAFIATIIARRFEVHRAHLIEHINPYNPYFTHFSQQFTGFFASQGMGPVIAARRLLEVTNRLVGRHAMMLAYNDSSWLLGMLFLAILPLTFLLPSKRPSHKIDAPAH